MVAAGQPAAAMPEAEHRVELLDELQSGFPAAHRPHVHGVPGRRLLRHLEDRERDVEPAAQVDEAVTSFELYGPVRAPALDQPVLEDEGAELRACRHVVDDLRALGPARGRAEMATA